MASIRVTQTITGLKSTVGAAATAGSDLMSLIDTARALATSGIALVQEIEHAKQQGLVSVWAEIGDTTPAADAGDPLDASDRNGFVRMVVSVVVPQDVAYAHRTPGSRGDRFVSHIIDGLNASFSELPDGGVALTAALGLADEGVSVTVGSSAVFADGNPLDGV